MKHNAPKGTFTLWSDQVPHHPESALWVDVLRWLVCVMDPADTRLGFIAGCLGYAASHGGLTDKQAAACNEIAERIRDDFKAGVLVCQNTAPRDETSAAQDIARLN